MRFLIPLFLLAPGVALAHPGPDHSHTHSHGDALGHDGFAAGLAHPLLGADHVIAMLAIGVVAGLLGGHARWSVPGAFLAGVLGFMLMGAGSAESALAQHLVIASIIVLGAVLVLALRVPVPLVTVAAAVFGAAHGYAHGAEGTGASGYLVGFMLATAALHGAGIALGMWIATRPVLVPRALGGVIALSGVALAFW